MQMDSPLPWHPAIVDVQIITIGSLAIVAVPGEFTWVLLIHKCSSCVNIGKSVSITRQYCSTHVVFIVSVPCQGEGYGRQSKRWERYILYTQSKVWNDYDFL